MSMTVLTHSRGSCVVSLGAIQCRTVRSLPSRLFHFPSYIFKLLKLAHYHIPLIYRCLLSASRVLLASFLNPRDSAPGVCPRWEPTERIAQRRNEMSIARIKRGKAKQTTILSGPFNFIYRHWYSWCARKNLHRRMVSLHHQSENFKCRKHLVK